MNKPIVVLGFGRSGTTWISDIISKMCGKLILFEPFHPSVTEFSEQISYSTIGGCLAMQLLSKVLSKRHRKPWLLRNHVPVKLEQISQDFVEQLWVECDVIGFKEIRANFMIEWLSHQLNPRIVFIIRHPCAVVSSIKRRQNFWEFGWPGTYELFLLKTIYGDVYEKHAIANLRKFVQGLSNDVERYAAMWAITHAIVLPILERLKIPLFFYEDFYSDPFSATRKLSGYLGGSRISIHPSHIFTPSMTTMKTFHGISSMEKSILEKGASLFWEGILTSEEEQKILNISRMFGIDIYDNSGAFHRNQTSLINTEQYDFWAWSEGNRIEVPKQVIP